MTDNIKRCFLCDYADKEVNTSKTMPLEEIIGEICRWMEVYWYGLKIEFYDENGGAYVEITLSKGVSFTKTYRKKKSFYIPAGNITKEHFSFIKGEVEDWFIKANEEYRKEYIKENGHEPKPEYWTRAERSSQG